MHTKQLFASICYILLCSLKRHDETGENGNHAIFDNSFCVSVHASSIATALMAYDANITIENVKGESKTMPLTEFFLDPKEDISRECKLMPGELITQINIPPTSASTKSFYSKEGMRESYDWSTADVAVVVEMKGSVCSNARIILGAAAPIPYRALKAEQVLNGKSVTKDLAKQVADAAMDDAKPLSRNSYKVPLFKSIIQQAIMVLS